MTDTVTPKSTILLIDDSQLVLDVVKKSLENGGYRVVTLESPTEFETGEVLVRERPQLILMDIDMPVLDGHTIVATLKEYGFLGETKVVFHTGRPALEAAMYVHECGADGSIQKTVDHAELLRLVGTYLESK